MSLNSKCDRWNLQYKNNSSQQWQSATFGISIKGLWWSQLALTGAHYLIFFFLLPKKSSSFGKITCWLSFASTEHPSKEFMKKKNNHGDKNIYLINSHTKMKQFFSSPGTSLHIRFFAYFFFCSTWHLASLRRRSKNEMWFVFFFLQRKPLSQFFPTVWQLSWFY